MSFDNGTKGKLEVSLNVNAFEMKSLKIGIEYQTDEKGHLFIKSVDGYKTLRQKIKSIRHRKPRDKKIAEIDNFFWELLDTWG